MRFARRLELLHFSTKEVPARDRHEAWVNRGWPSLAPIYRTEPLVPFAVSSESLGLGEIVIHYVTMTGQRWTRDAAMLRSGATDALVVALTLEGEAHGAMGARSFRTGPGSVQLCDLGQESSHVSSASRTILAIIPRAVATAKGLDVAALHGVVLTSGAASMLAPHLLSLRSMAATLTVAEGAQLGRMFLEMLTLAAATVANPASKPLHPRTAAARAVRLSIESRLGSAGLTIANLCRELGISRATLHRLFETEGGVQAYIRQRRLEAVRLALSDPDSLEPIHALAERFAFSDAAHLSRLFRSRFGLTPSDHRARARDS